MAAKKKKKAKTSQELRQIALKTLQKLVRLKAADDTGYATCVSCGCSKKWNEGMQGGHFIPKGSSSRWALEEENVHPQCSSCNQFGMKHGSAEAQYTLYMIDTYGKDHVEMMLETKKDSVKFYSADYREMIAEWDEEISKQLQRVGL